MDVQRGARPEPHEQRRGKSDARTGDPAPDLRRHPIRARQPLDREDPLHDRDLPPPTPLHIRIPPRRDRRQPPLPADPHSRSRLTRSTHSHAAQERVTEGTLPHTATPRERLPTPRRFPFDSRKNPLLGSLSRSSREKRFGREKRGVIGRVAAVAAVVLAVVVVAVILLSGGSSYQVKAVFEDASQIV